MKSWIVLSTLLILVLTVFTRVYFEAKHPYFHPKTHKLIGSKYDPRASYEKLQSLRFDRETVAFRNRLARGSSADIPWPGLRAMQSSWLWLEMGAGITKSESYTGDFSWLFSKLSTLMNISNKNEKDFLFTMLPFFLVISKDGAGTTLVVNEVIKRYPEESWSWFLAGYHAFDNLKDKRLADDLWQRCIGKYNCPSFIEKEKSRTDEKSVRDVVKKAIPKGWSK